jgi:hypothetical protein
MCGSYIQSEALASLSCALNSCAIVGQWALKTGTYCTMVRMRKRLMLILFQLLDASHHSEYYVYPVLVSYISPLAFSSNYCSL